MTFPFFLSLKLPFLTPGCAGLEEKVEPPSVEHFLPTSISIRAAAVSSALLLPEQHTHSFSTCLYCASIVKIWGLMLTGFDTLVVTQRQVFWSSASQPVNTFIKQLSSAPGSRAFSSFPLVRQCGRATRCSFVESKQRQSFELRYIFTFCTSFFFFPFNDIHQREMSWNEREEIIRSDWHQVGLGGNGTCQSHEWGPNAWVGQTTTQSEQGGL